MLLSSEVTAAVQAAGQQLATAKMLELEYEQERGVKQVAAILRIIGTDNPVTGKPHSGSSAKDIVEQDADYAGFLVNYRKAVALVINSRADYEVAVAVMRAASFP